MKELLFWILFSIMIAIVVHTIAITVSRPFRSFQEILDDRFRNFVQKMLSQSVRFMTVQTYWTRAEHRARVRALYATDPMIKEELLKEAQRISEGIENMTPDERMERMNK